MNLLETASGLALRYLNEQQVAGLRAGYLDLRKKLHPLMRTVYGTFDSNALRAHLEERIGRDFEILMVHSSVNHMKPMFGDSPLDLVRMLIDFCGPERTLAMPAFYFGDPAIGGAFATFQQRPRFDLRRTPSQMGLATELFRRMPGVLQSRHPVYRISALGPLAGELTRGHEHAVGPAGRGSPFDFMAARRTRIIGIGKPIQVITQVHHAEQIMGDEFPGPGHWGERLAMTLVDGKEELPFELNPGRIPDGEIDVWKLQHIMKPETLHQWAFHHVPMFSTTADAVTMQLTDAARRGSTLYDRS
ncbi:MAG: AAC(3) family N-acetyltransferase [Burkholderiaceae bacterium]